MRCLLPPHNPTHLAVGTKDEEGTWRKAGRGVGSGGDQRRGRHAAALPGRQEWPRAGGPAREGRDSAEAVVFTDHPRRTHVKESFLAAEVM